MSDKDHFTFDDEDESPKSSVTKKEKTREPDAGGETFFDTEEELPGTSLGERADTEESDKGHEEFFFDTEEDDPKPEHQDQLDLHVSEDDQDNFSGDADLFGDNLNAGFPENEDDVEDPVDFAPEPQEKRGGSKNRTLLMVLLLVIVVAGGAYYFMGLGSSTPSVPTVKVPVEAPSKAVVVPPPPPPAKAPAEKTTTGKEQPVTVAVPPPPASDVDKAETKPAATAVKPAPLEPPGQKLAKPAPTEVALPAPVPAPVPVNPAPAVAEKASTVSPVQTAETSAAKTKVATKPAEVDKPAVVPPPVAAPKQVVDGAYELDAGSYLLDSNRKALVAKIAEFGYQPLVTPVDATIDMTRLRLGTYSKEDVQASLAFAREIEPGSYSVPAGDGYVIYAGTFLKTKNLETIKARFLDEGIQVKSEPVQVVRTLSRVRFGSFESKEDAVAAARIVAKGGVKATVVKAR